ncbi:DUF4862 family protein [Corynebacterium mendelii]|uniref:DUF4862 family protein n=1 Tax=Corynebacterium mendelii TaxID=2765362 RepID=A0A939IU92_9CORY|nr:DUF4862 family protein [Corynebacterium mendelii]MBN9644689.1 DUF4862 family protein [Corynebacterium mendelii]
MNTSPTPFVVGAYASMPGDSAGQARYYDMLADTGWVTGIEVPFPGQLADHDSRDWLGGQLAGRFPHSIVTAIPGTMVNVWRDKNFGLGSPDELGRKQAIDFTARIHAAVTAVHATHGQIFDAVAVHSAPTHLRTAKDFTESLKEVLSWEWGDTRIIIEHCDKDTASHTPEKGFLPIEEELAIAGQLGIKVSVNWGRIAVEARNGEEPNTLIGTAAKTGCLAGVVFSGASPAQTIYGGPWADGHLPASDDEPTSLMTPEIIAEATGLAGEVDFFGAKCCVPPESGLDERLAMLTRIARPTGVVTG